MVVLTNKGEHDKRPQRQGFATSRASGPTFEQQTRSGFGAKAASLSATGGKMSAPFTGANAAALKKQYAAYSVSAQGCIARALTDPFIAHHLNTQQGTAPELVVLGDAMLRGMRLNVDLFWQSKTFRNVTFNPSGRSFPVDILKVRGGEQWYEPVDGLFFHQATVEEITRDGARNASLAVSGGHVVVVTDAVCQSREMLRAYLDAQGAP